MPTQATTDPLVRFVQFVEFTDACWLWKGGLSGKGYGTFWCSGRMVKAHRFAYAHLKGPIPLGLTLDHLCCVITCVNPDHLEPVTGHENILRGGGVTAINALKTHCTHGHEFTPENTRTRKDGGRVCRQCNSDYGHAWRAALAR